MNCIVTGGAGYIGSHAVRALCDADHRVLVIDDLSRGHRELIDKRATFVTQRLQDTGALTKILKEFKCDVVLNFAAFIDVAESVRQPQIYFENNTQGVDSLLKAMKAGDCKRIIFSSTAAVYGEPKRVPIFEEDAKNPVNPYGESKLRAEKLIADYVRDFGFSAICFRYFNVAGAHPSGEIGEHHEPETHLIPLIIERAMQGKPAQVFGTDYPTPDGSCVRDYVHVCDLVDAHVLGIKAMSPGQFLEFNLGSEQGFSVLEVISVVESVTKTTLKIESHPRREGDPSTLVASSGRAREILKWNPKRTTLPLIIGDACRWHNRLHNRSS